jgi:hypothetical protein
MLRLPGSVLCRLPRRARHRQPLQQRGAADHDRHPERHRVHDCHKNHVSEAKLIISFCHFPPDSLSNSPDDSPPPSSSTATDFGYTVYRYTSPRPTSTTCPDRNAGARIVPQLVGSMLVTTRAPGPTPAVVPRGQDDRGGKCKDCLPVVEGISSACGCFFPPGPQQTVTRQQTVTVVTVTVTTTTSVLPARTRTLAGMS